MSHANLFICYSFPSELDEAFTIIKNFLESLDRITLTKCELTDGQLDVEFTHKWSVVRFIAEGLKQLIKNDYRPGLDVWSAVQNELSEHGIDSRLETWG